MKLIMGLILFTISLFAYGQETSAEIGNASQNSVFKEASRLFADGKYRSAADELTNVEKKLEESKSLTKSLKGFIFYWKAICYNKNQDFGKAIENFDKSLGQDYSPIDLNYEYGQALFAADKLSDARLQFRESLKKKFKRGVSLYYIAFISRELGDKKKAVTFFKAIDKLDAEEAKDVKQAAQMQIGDIYLEQVEKQPDAFKSVETYVIPQYNAALAINRESALASDIKEKIRGLESKYDLVLFKMRNGRPTLIPPYFLRLALEYGVDSNVTFAPTEQQIAESKKSSSFVRTDALGRYTFYFKNFLSVAPEFRANYTRYNNRVAEIYRNDNYLLAPAIRTAYEHTLFSKPAATLFDYDFSQAKRDVDAKEELKFAFRSHTLMLGERFNYLKNGETILRLRRRQFESYLDASDSRTTSLVLEQVLNYTSNTFVIYSSYDVTRVNNNAFDTNSLTFRGDVIMSPVKTWFTPSFGVGLTSTDPVNDPSRGTELLVNPSGRLSRVLMKNMRGNLKFDYQNNKSKDEENFAYKKYIYSFELEYVF